VGRKPTPKSSAPHWSFGFGGPRRRDTKILHDKGQKPKKASGHINADWLRSIEESLVPIFRWVCRGVAGLVGVGEGEKNPSLRGPTKLD